MPAPDIAANLDVFFERFVLPAYSRDVHIISFGESVSGSYRWPPTGSLQPEVSDAFRAVLCGMAGTSGMPLTNCADPGGTFSEGFFPGTIQQGGNNWASITQATSHPLAWQFCASAASYTGGAALTDSAATGATNSAWSPGIEDAVAIPATFSLYGALKTLDMAEWNIYWACLASSPTTGDVGVYGGSGGSVTTTGTFDFTTPLTTLTAQLTQQNVTKTTVTTNSGFRRSLAFRRPGYLTPGVPSTSASVTGMSILYMSARAPTAFRRGVRVGTGLSYGGQLVSTWSASTCADTQNTVMAGERPDGLLPVWGRNDAGSGTSVSTYMTNYQAGMARALTASPNTTPIIWGVWKADNTGASLDRVNQYSSALYEYAMDNRYPWFDGSQIMPTATQLPAAYDGTSGHLSADGFSILTRRLSQVINNPRSRSRRMRSIVSMPG